MSTGGPRKEILLTLSGGKGHILLRLPRGWREDPGMTLQRAKPHRSSTEAPRSPAGSRAGLEGGAWGSQDGAPLHPPIPVPVSMAGPPSPALEVAGAGGQEHVVGMPVQAEDGGANGLLDVLANPPGHGRQTGREETGTHRWAPANPEAPGSHWAL